MQGLVTAQRRDRGSSPQLLNASGWPQTTDDPSPTDVLLQQGPKGKGQECRGGSPGGSSGQCGFPVSTVDQVTREAVSARGPRTGFHRVEWPVCSSGISNRSDARITRASRSSLLHCNLLVLPQETTPTSRLWHVLPQSTRERGEKEITSRNFQKYHFLLQPKLERVCAGESPALNNTETTVTSAHQGVRCPSPSPVYVSAVSQENAPSFSQWDGWHVPDVTQALISPGRPRGRGIHLPLPGPRPQLLGPPQGTAT